MDESDARYVAPFAVTGDPSVAFLALRRVLAAYPRTRIVASTDSYVRATCRTRLGFVDDVECCLWSEDRLVHVRSASRHALLWDLGVNRRRVESLRRRLSSAAG